MRARHPWRRRQRRLLLLLLLSAITISQSLQVHCELTARRARGGRGGPSSWRWIWPWRRRDSKNLKYERKRKRKATLYVTGAALLYLSPLYCPIQTLLLLWAAIALHCNAYCPQAERCLARLTKAHARTIRRARKSSKRGNSSCPFQAAQRNSPGSRYQRRNANRMQIRM